MKNRTLFAVLAIFLLINLANAYATISDSEKNNAESIISSKIGCDKLIDEQLEAIGDYYMEQMHPGEAHEMMDKMMGGEGSESLRQVHINMAKTIYCGESSGMMGSGGMMGMMNMMGGGMMGGQNLQTNMMGNYGNMMGNSNYFWMYGFIGMIFWIAVLIALILLIVLLYKKISHNDCCEHEEGHKKK